MNEYANQGLVQIEPSIKAGEDPFIRPEDKGCLEYYQRRVEALVSRALGWADDEYPLYYGEIEIVNWGFRYSLSPVHVANRILLGITGACGDQCHPLTEKAFATLFSHTSR